MLDQQAERISRATARRLSRWPRFDRFLVLLAAAGATAAFIADANPWHVVVLEDLVLPLGAVVTLMAFGGLVLHRWGAGVLAFGVDVVTSLPLALQLALLASGAVVASVAAFGITAMIVLVGALWEADGPVVMAAQPSSDVEVVVERSGCSSFEPHSQAYLFADRGLASRRVPLGEFNDCGGYTYEFLAGEDTLVVEYASCWTYRVDFDPDTLTILAEQFHDAWDDDCGALP